jgi:hypothetical protein
MTQVLLVGPAIFEHIIMYCTLPFRLRISTIKTEEQIQNTYCNLNLRKKELLVI